MKRRFLFPIVIAAALALSACAGGAPASPGTPPAPPAESSNESSESPDSAPPAEGTAPATELPSGAEATVTIDGRVYEFTSDSALLGVNLPGLGCRLTLDTGLTVDLSLVAIDGEHNTDGGLFLIVGDGASEKLSTFDLRANSFGAADDKVKYLAGGSLTDYIYSIDNQDDTIEHQPLTITRNGLIVSGSQQVYNTAEGSANPGVGTVQVDARCVNF